jgi:hypothetical protein
VEMVSDVSETVSVSIIRDSYVESWCQHAVFIQKAAVCLGPAELHGTDKSVVYKIRVPTHHLAHQPLADRETDGL